MYLSMCDCVVLVTESVCRGESVRVCGSALMLLFNLVATFKMKALSSSGSLVLALHMVGNTYSGNQT